MGFCNKACPPGTEGTIITGNLIALNNPPASDRHELPFFGVGVIAVIKETRVIAGQHKLSAEIQRPIGISLEIFLGDLWQTSDIDLGQDLIEGGVKAPDHAPYRDIFAGENSGAVYRARSNARLYDKHAADSPWVKPLQISRIRRERYVVAAMRGV